MTQEQQNNIFLATRKIQEARSYLDTAMYYTGEPMEESEFQKVREAYDLLCRASDKL